MSISQEDLFKLALNLQSPWLIDSIDFDVEGKRLDIHIDFERGGKFPCPKCGNSECDVHERISKNPINGKVYILLILY